MRSPASTKAMIALAAGIGLLVAAAPTDEIVAVTNQNELIRFQRDAPGLVYDIKNLTGLMPGERVIGIDFRPNDNELYAVGTSNRLYRIHIPSGGANPVTGLPFVPGLSGFAFGIDVDPVGDELRILSDVGSNFRIDLLSGLVSGLDTLLFYEPGDPNFGITPTVAAAAHSSSFVGATSTTLYAIDSNLDVLARVGSSGGLPDLPGTGKMHTIGPLGVDVLNVVAFDIKPHQRATIAAQVPGGLMHVYDIDLNTGAATQVGTVPNAAVFDGLAFVLDDLDNDGFPNDVEDAAGPDPTDPGDTPFDGSPAPTPAPTLELVAKLRIKIVFDPKKPDRDRISIKGRLPVPVGFQKSESEGREVVIDIGGVAHRFMLDHKGRSTPKSKTERFRFYGKEKDGFIKFSAKIKKGNFALALAGDGLLDGADVKKLPVTVPVLLYYEPDIYSMDAELEYSAKAGKKGSAK